MRKILQSFARNRAGVTAIEYAVIAAAIVVAIASVVASVGNSTSATFNSVQNAM